MKVRNCLVGAAAAVLAIGSAAWASDSAPVLSQSDNSAQVAASGASAPDLLSTPMFADDSAPTSAPLMHSLELINVGQPLEKIGLNIGGYVEMGYLYDMTVPGDVTPSKTAPGNKIFFPGVYKNAPMLNQFDLNISRAVDASKGKFDVGFMIEALYGRDAFFTHSNGILDNNNKDGGGPDDQLDLEQAYVTFAIPLGTGLTIEAGKFATLLGGETINPTTNLFYTHSYIFSYGVPLTQTGVLATYNLTSNLAMTAGMTRGWNQTLYDVNGEPDFLGQVVYTSNDKKLSVIGNLSIGAEQPHDNAHYQIVAEVIPSYKLSDQLTLSGDFLYGLANSFSQWYGIAGYASYQLDKWVAINDRFEYYHDGGGFTAGVSPAGVTDVNYWELTAGVGVTPLPDNAWASSLTIRPEVRFDVADHAAFDGTKFNEVNFAVDAYWKF